MNKKNEKFQVFKKFEKFYSIFGKNEKFHSIFGKIEKLNSELHEKEDSKISSYSSVFDSPCNAFEKKW